MMIQKTVSMRNYSRYFYHFHNYHTKILSGDFNAREERKGENILKLTIGNESRHPDSNDNGGRIVNIAASKNLVLKSTMFPHRDIHNYTCTSADGKTLNYIGYI